MNGLSFLQGILILLAVFAGSLVLYDSVMLGKAVYLGGKVADASRRYEQHPEAPVASLLVVGDSTAVGTGASSPELSLAGRIGAEVPGAHIDNLARNGAKTAEVVDQLSRAPLSSYEAVLIQVGGNDALRFTPLGEVAAAIDTVLERAKELGDYVALISTGDLGEAPALPWPANRVFGWRSRELRDRFAEVAAERGVAYVDLFDSDADRRIHRDPQKFYARDGLHLSGAGYGIWYDRLKQATALPEVLAAETGQR